MNAVLPERWLRLIPMATPRGLRIVRGEGAYVWDEEDRRYLDLDGDAGAALLGHSQQMVLEAVERQLSRLTSLHHTFDSDARDELVEALSVMTPEGLTDVVLVSSGAEAVDAAITTARLVTRRPRVVVMQGAARGPHADSNAPVERGRGSRVLRDADVVRVAFGDADALEAALDRTVAAVVVEPIQVEAGVQTPADGYLAAVSKSCQRHDVLLIVDEVDTALRTRGLLVSAQDRVVPDILCMARGLAGGLPIGVMVTRQEVARRLRARPGWHDSMEAGNPLVCAAAAATITIATNPALQAHAGTIGDYLLSRLRALRIQEIREVRGQGLIIALELRHSSAPVLQALEDRGVLAIPGGNTVIRLMPPLILERRQVDVAVETIAVALRAARRAGPPQGDEVALQGVAQKPLRR